MARIIIMTILILAFAADPGFRDGRFGLGKAAHADDHNDRDDDDDDRGGDDDDDDRGGRAGGGRVSDRDDDRDDRGARPRGTTRQPQRQARRAPRAAPVVLDVAVPNEIVSLGLTPEALGAATALGYRVLEAREIGLLGLLNVRFAPPAGRDLAAARAELAALAPGAATDLNHYYRTEEAVCEGAHCAAFDQIAWPAVPPVTPLPAGCDPGGTIGMIDTGINPEHATFAAGRIERISLAREGTRASGLQHGTAVAAILVGAADSRSPGLLPGARLIAVDTFHREGQDERADVFSLLAALDLLAERGVSVINLSMAGPPNDTLAAMIARLDAAGIVVVAAAGNDGPRAEPTYPAAYPPVIAVTAVDGAGQVYRRAGQGDHIDIAAPGVNVWTAASVSGARPKTGTSFAVPYVTAAAYLLAPSAGSPAAVAGALAAAAEDLGDPGRDSVFGAGLLNAAAVCTPPAPAPLTTTAPTD